MTGSGTRNLKVYPLIELLYSIDYLSIILQYAYILHRNVHWSNHTIRLIQLFDSTKIYPRGRRQKVDIEQKLCDLLNEVRIDAEPIVYTLSFFHDL